MSGRDGEGVAAKQDRIVEVDEVVTGVHKQSCLVLGGGTSSSCPASSFLEWGSDGETAGQRAPLSE